MGDRDFGAVAAAFRVEAGFSGFVAAIRQQGPRGKDQIKGPGKPDRDADQREAEQFERRVVELLADVTHQQIHAAPQQGEGAAEHGGKRQRQQNPGRGNAASMAPGFDNRQQRCHDGRVGDNARNRGNHDRHQGDQPPGRADPFRGDQAAQPVEGSAFEQGCRHREESEQGDQSRTAEADQGVIRLEHATGHQQADAEQAGQFGGDRTADEQHHSQHQNGQGHLGHRILDRADQFDHPGGSAVTRALDSARSARSAPPASRADRAGHPPARRRGTGCRAPDPGSLPRPPEGIDRSGWRRHGAGRCCPGNRAGRAPSRDGRPSPGLPDPPPAEECRRPGSLREWRGRLPPTAPARRG